MKLKDARTVYESVKVPENLESRVKRTLLEYGGKPVRKRHTALRWAVCAAASVCVAFIACVNAIPVFAQELYDIPVIGGMARIFTLNRFEEADETAYIRVEIPALSDTGNDELERRVNYEIALQIDSIADAAKERARQYYEAFTATGGKKEEFIPFEIGVDYEVKCNNGKWVSFVITEYETHASFYSETYYYNIDLETGRDLTLANLLGENYIEIVNKAVREGIAAREAEDPDAEFFHDELGFKTIGADQSFYINENGNPVAVFEKYDIAPGYMGAVEFEIPISPAG